MARTRPQPARIEEVNLVPIMSILVILIPLLIYAFTFFEVSVQSVSAPRRGMPDHDAAAERGPTVTVVVKPRALVLRHLSSDGRPEQTTIAAQPSAAGTEQNFAALHNELLELKRRFPEETRLRLGGDPNVPWQTFASAIDSARVELNGAPFVGADADRRYRKAAPRTRRGEPVALFPDIVFVVND